MDRHDTAYLGLKMFKIAEAKKEGCLKRKEVKRYERETLRRSNGSNTLAPQVDV